MALLRLVCENRRVDGHDLYEMSSIKGGEIKGVGSRLERRKSIAVEDMRQSRRRTVNDDN